MLREITWQIGQNFVGISMAAPLKYLLVALKVVVLEKVGISNTKLSKTVC